MTCPAAIFLQFFVVSGSTTGSGRGSDRHSVDDVDADEDVFPIPNLYWTQTLRFIVKSSSCLAPFPLDFDCATGLVECVQEDGGRNESDSVTPIDSQFPTLDDLTMDGRSCDKV